MAEARIVLALLAFAGTLATGEADAAWIVEDANYAVGEEVALTLRCRWPASAELVRPPDPAELLRGELVTAIGPKKTWRDGDDAVAEWELRVVPRESDAWIIPAPDFAIRRDDGEVATVDGEELILEVATGEDRNVELSDPSPLFARPPPGRGSSPWWWLVLPIVGGAIAAAILIAKRAREGRRARPPIEEFLDEIERISKLDEGKLAGSRLSLAVRRYCGDSFGFDGPGSTSVECEDHLRGEISDRHRIELRKLLARLDGLRWASEELRAAQVLPLSKEAASAVREIERERVERLRAEEEAQRDAARTGARA